MNFPRKRHTKEAQAIPIPVHVQIPDPPETVAELSVTARSRLSPRITNPNYLVLRSRRRIFETWLLQSSAPLAVLDIGGRYQPYRPLLESRASRYVALDILQTKLLDVVADAEALPFAPETFDLVIATQVFEYLPQPAQAAAQIHAILKPGGTLFMSVPGMAPTFGDHQQWRFAPAGLSRLLAPFSSVEILPETSSFGGLIRTTNVALHTFAHFTLLRKIFSLTLCPCLNLLGLLDERTSSHTNNQYVANYSILARKFGP